MVTIIEADPANNDHCSLFIGVSIDYLCSSGSRKQFEIGENRDEKINYYAVCDQVAHDLLLGLSCACLQGEIVVNLWS